MSKSDKDAIKRVLNDGSSAKRPMFVDFHIAANDEDAAHKIAEACRPLGYRITGEQDDGETTWTVTCSTRMMLTLEGVLAFQKELDDIARPLGGHIDGWGTFGNE